MDKQEHIPHDNQYFVMGNNKILVKEHFRDDGRPLETILTNVILDAEKAAEIRINTAKTE